MVSSYVLGDEKDKKESIIALQGPFYVREKEYRGSNKEMHSGTSDALGKS
jgi:hypothetical protein